MKTIRKIGMALFAVLMSVNFTSCDKENDDSVGGGSSNQSGKKLVKVMEYDGSGDMQTKFEFKYNQAGNVSEFTESYIDNGKWVKEAINISWNSNKSLTLTNEEDEELEVLLSYGKFTRWGSCNFTYNEDGFLKRIEDKDGFSTYTIAYTWDGNYLYSIDYQEKYNNTTNDWTESVRYGDKTCKGFLPIFGESMGIPEFGLFMAMPELVGIKTINLPTKINGKFATTFDYKLDADGYVTKCTVEELSVEPEQTLYEFVWE